MHLYDRVSACLVMYPVRAKPGPDDQDLKAARSEVRGLRVMYLSLLSFNAHIAHSKPVGIEQAQVGRPHQLCQCE